MNNSELMMSLFLALAVGATVGILFFATLWISVRSMAKPGALRHLALGALVRAVLILVTTAWALSTNVTLPVVLAGLSGFIIVRYGAAYVARPAGSTNS